MEHNRSSTFSFADFLPLACALIMLFAFLFMPWVNVLGFGSTGVQLLSDTQATSGAISLLWLIPIAAVGGGLAALWGLFDVRSRRTAATVTLLSGLAALVYYGYFFIQNSQSLIDATGFVGVGFWVALLAAIGLVLQIAFSRSTTELKPPDTIPTTKVSSYPDAVNKWIGALDDLKDRVPVGLFRFREAGIAVAFLLLCVFFWWQKQDVFLRPANLAVIMRFIAIYGILAIGELLVIITGGIDLSVGSMTALTGVLVATLMMKGVEAVPAPATVPAIVFALVFLGLLAFWRGIVVPRLRVPPLGNTLGTVLIVLVGLLVVIWAVVNGFGAIPPLDILPSILIVLVFAGLVGLWHGLFVTKLHIPPFIITLGTWLMASGLAALITRGYPIVFPTGFSFLSLGQGEVTLGGESGLQLPNMFLVLMAAAVLVSFILSITTTGRHIYAVGGDIEASRVSGINVDRVRIFCYITSGVMAGLVGILLASRLGEGTPTVGQTYELWAIAATVIGGTSLFGGEGSVLGVILGAAIMGVMSNGMVLINVSSYIQQIVLGVVLVVAVTYDMWRRRRQS